MVPKYLFLFPPQVEKLNKAEYEGSSDKSVLSWSLFRNLRPLCPCYFIQKLLLRNTSSVITVIQVVSVCPQKCCMVWYTSKDGVSHNPMLHSRHLNFVLVSFFLMEHKWVWILFPSKGQCLLGFVWSLKYAYAWGLSSFSCGLSSRHCSRLFY